MLPEFLQPSIPTKSNAAWKNAEQRAAEKAARLARVAGLPPPHPPLPERWVRVPVEPALQLPAAKGAAGSDAVAAESAAEGAEVPAAAAAVPAVLPAVLPAGQQERQLSGLEVWLPAPPEDAADDGLGGLGSPYKRKGWGKQPLVDAEGRPLPPKKSYAPHSQEAQDAKSGKGRRRLFLHPIIRTRDRCGKCAVGDGCLGWDGRWALQKCG